MRRSSPSALAATLCTGGLPKLEGLGLSKNHIGKQGVAALSLALRKHPKLNDLDFEYCEIGDDGVAALVDNLGKDDFKTLKHLWLSGCGLTDIGCATLVTALDAVRMPRLFNIQIHGNSATSAAIESVESRVQARRA